MLNRLAQVALGLSLLASTSFAAVIVTFDGVGAPTGDASYPGNGNVGNAADASFDTPLMPLGVEFIGDVNTRFLATNFGGGAMAPLAGNYLQVNSVNDSSLTQSVIRMSFDRGNDDGTWAVGSLLFLDLQDGQMNVQLQAYDKDGNPLGGVINFSSEVGTISFATMAGLTAFDRVDYVLITDTGGDGYILDNLHFELASEVPEPSTFVLMSIGLAGAGLLRRRR